MKIKFDMKYRPQIESGEYKVFALEHEEQEARIVCWDNKGDYPIIALVDNEPEKFDKHGRIPGGNRGGEFSLFIITPEPELSEDERIRKAIGAAICGTTAENVLEANGVRLTDALTYLEKQKEYIEDIRQYAYNKGLVDAEGKHQPVEWSEEDEKMLRLCENRIMGTGTFVPTKAGLYGMVSWLKSLRPQPHWKPSEEQMEALRISYKIGTANESWAMRVLETLYSDLKNL